MIEQLKAMLRFDEGFTAKPRADTDGGLVIGYGHNFKYNLLSKRAGEAILDDDLGPVLEACIKFIPRWSELGEARQAVLANMVFQLGISGVLKFKNMMAALRADDGNLAATEMLDSPWATIQTPRRAHRLAAIMKSGMFPDKYGS